MADDVNALGDWIEQNVDAPGMKGSPEWVQKTEQYRQLRQAQISPPDPNSWGNTAKRIATGAVTGIPDTAIGIGNAAVRASKSMPFNFGMAGVRPEDNKEAPYIGPQVNAAMGGQELPADASVTRRLLEGGASALPGGVAGLVRAVAAAPNALRAILAGAGSLTQTTVAPTVASHVGGDVGGYTADKLGLDKETGALLGSLLGGAAPTGAPALGRYGVHSYYAGKGRPEAPQIAAAAARQDVPTTAGMLGNQDVQLAERAVGNSPGAMGYINDRRQSARDAMGAALDRLATERGGIDAQPTPGTIGARVSDTARTAADDLRATSQAGQEQLATRVGNEPVPVQSVFESGYGQMPNLSVPGREAIDYRLTSHLAPLLNRDATGQPILDQSGSPTVNYDLLRQWRTDLGRSFDQGRFPPATAQLYEPVTAAMRDTAERRGVPPQEFDATQGLTRSVEQRDVGRYPVLDDIANREPNAAFNFVRGGEQNPGRLQTLGDTGRPEVPGIFGDYLRLIGQQTLDQPGARGPINFANRIDSMAPEARSTIAGPQEPGVTDISTLARALDYPTSQTGLGRTMGPVAGGAARAITGNEIGGALGRLIGLPGAETVGRVAGAASSIPIARTRAWLQQHDVSRNAMAGGAAPQGPSIGDLVAAINAANASQQQQGGPRRGVPR